MLHELRRVLHTETGASDSAHIDSRIHSQALQYGKADTVKIGTWMYANNPSLFLQRKAQRFGAAFSDTAPDTAMMNISRAHGVEVEYVDGPQDPRGTGGEAIPAT